MANTNGPALAFKLGLLLGVYNFGTGVVRASTAADTFKGALYLSSASIGPSTGAYTATGEASGAGYTAGGETFTFGTAPALDGTTAIVTPSASISWTGLTAGPFDCLLMYNDTQAGNPSVGAFTFAAQTVAGNFSLSMPANAAATALIRIA